LNIQPLSPLSLSVEDFEEGSGASEIDVVAKLIICTGSNDDEAAAITKIDNTRKIYQRI
jgi:hypothetical protein